MTAPNIPYDQRPYRPCVGIFLLNSENKLFAGRRLDNRAEAWQMPQGGIDHGESVMQACLREMDEEIGTCKAQPLEEHDSWLNYDIPQTLADRLWHGQYRGQRQKWVALRFTGTDDDINIDTDIPEFCEWMWIEPEKLVELAVPFKREVYRTLMDAFAPLLKS
ncbi:MAG: RNA pyrophosphohydrolase [Bacteroidetes bacterium]|jgi:putative (di)nucleoside polyphosphate hydrolase|nr:RNA pyrophosphohydrolase [Bacteroidota bacterium]